MEATVVVDNRGNGILSGEWGLCIYIEYGEKHILLDTGASTCSCKTQKSWALI